MELYHNQLKLRLINEKDSNEYQRADWLVDKLGTKVHSYFWLDEYSGKDDFARYWKDEWFSGLTAWRKSLKIPDADVTMEGKCTKVVDQEDRDAVHIIWNPGSEFGLCDCKWAITGNLCEHVLKTIRYFRDKRYVVPSVSMFQYHQALINMLHSPPYDSLVRDHAVSLAVWVKMQLYAQIGQDSSGITSNSVEEEAVDQTTEKQDRVVVNENHYTNGNVGSAFKQKHLGCGTDDLKDAMDDEMASENGTCDRSGKEVSCVRMETNPSSHSTVEPQLFPLENTFDMNSGV